MQDDKYIVFKRDDAQKADGISFWLEGDALKDAVVIRKQDVFSGPALYSYAHRISLVARLMRDKDPEQSAQLMKIADYFAEQAEDSSGILGKLPD